MRKLIMNMSMSIDGFVGGPTGENDWVFKSGGEEPKSYRVKFGCTAGLIIMGRKPFEVMAPYWPTTAGTFVPLKNGFSKAGQTSAAVSPAAVGGFDSNLANGIRKLKDEPGSPLAAVGGAGFMRSLIATGLIDEYHLFIHPVALGSGEPIFTDLELPLNLKLVDVKTFSCGGIALIYCN